VGVETFSKTPAFGITPAATASREPINPPRAGAFPLE
jgi:hypothetical protein